MTASINLSEARQHVDHMLRQVRRAHLAGKRKRADRLGETYLRSYHARFLAVNEAWKKIDFRRRPGKETLPGYAERLNAWEGSEEEVTLILKVKAPGEFRYINDYGIEHRSLQQLILPLLRARADLHPAQFGIRGTHKAILHAATLIETGMRWGIETDLSNCYGSFDGKKIPGFLPIPKRVVERSLLSATLYLSLGNSPTFGPADDDVEDEQLFPELFAAARQGFPQGSATSPLAVEIVLAPVFSHLPNQEGWVAYSDNTLALGSSEAEVVAMTTALWSALKAHPGGHLRPKKVGVCAPGQAIDFLGHRLRLVSGKVLIEVSLENLFRFNKRLLVGLSRIESAPDILSRKSRADRLRFYVQSWCSAFQLALQTPEIHQDAIVRIKQAEETF